MKCEAREESRKKKGEERGDERGEGKRRGGEGRASGRKREKVVSSPIGDGGNGYFRSSRKLS